MSERRVLYGEDDFLNGKLFEILLRKEGVDCDVARDGETAVHLFDSGRYGAVILDAYLPGMNGAEVARIVRVSDPGITLVGLTSDEGAVATLYDAGFDRVFLKPLRGRECLDYVLSQL
ncbi:MAG TPA: response regulator [Spirochaetia bacterium]|nr:response regulator [Spirochaetia bacterium]